MQQRVFIVGLKSQSSRLITTACFHNGIRAGSMVAWRRTFTTRHRRAGTRDGAGGRRRRRTAPATRGRVSDGRLAKGRRRGEKQRGGGRRQHHVRPGTPTASGDLRDGGGGVLNRGRQSETKRRGRLGPGRRTDGRGCCRGDLRKNVISKANCGRLFAKLSHLHPYPSYAHLKVLIGVSKVCTR